MDHPEPDSEGANRWGVTLKPVMEHFEGGEGSSIGSSNTARQCKAEMNWKSFEEGDTSYIWFQFLWHASSHPLKASSISELE